MMKVLESPPLTMPLKMISKAPLRQRVLVVEDDTDYRAILCSVLTRCNGDFELESVGTLSVALKAIECGRPEVILIDLDLPDSSGYPTFVRIREAAREACLIVLTGTDDQKMALKAIEYGAHDYLVKSLIQPAMIPQRIQMALRRRRNPRCVPQPVTSREGLVLGFLGSKGGVGTSTLAENLAAIVAMGGMETMIVDLQPSPERTEVDDPNGGTHDLSRLFAKPPEVITLADVKECATRIMQGLSRLRMPLQRGLWRPWGAEYVHAIVTLTRRFCPCVVLDLGSRVDESAVAALQICNSVALVMDTEPAAADGCAAILRQMRTLLSPPKPEIRLVAVDRSHYDQRMAADQRLKLRPDLTITPAADDLSSAYLAGMPLLATSHPDEAFNRSVQGLADLLVRSEYWRTAVN